MSRAPSRASILLTAFETVALESFSSAAAPRVGAKLHDLGENRQPFEVRQSGHGSNLETMSFDSFYF